MNPLIHDPGGLGSALGDLYAWVVDHGGTEGEGLLGMGAGALVFGKRELAEHPSIRQIAEMVARETGKPVRLVHFTRAETITVDNGNAPG